jgi:1-acyl-sn-glycerol-3-phosphate acyltransferase
MIRALERAGVNISVSGIEHLQGLDSPCVIIGNHVSMMETTVLPGIISPIRRVTFVIKKSLLAYPVFKHLMRSRNPVAVTRNNPRQDLKTVLEQGMERLKQGISIVVFPQTTRGSNFDPEQFNTIGIKLASKAGVPVLPLALKTDAWTNGKWIKDLGRILPERKAYFAFDTPFMVQGKGREEQQRVIDFISSKLIEWNEGNPP